MSLDEWFQARRTHRRTIHALSVIILQDVARQPHTEGVRRTRKYAPPIVVPFPVGIKEMGIPSSPICIGNNASAHDCVLSEYQGKMKEGIRSMRSER
jgi:hypothetical protein